MIDDRNDLDAAIVQGLAQAVPQVDPPADLRARVLESIGAAAVSSPKRGFSGSFLWLATAATLTLVLGLSLYTGQLRRRVRAVEVDLRRADARAAAREQQAAEAQRDAAAAQSSLLVLTAPDMTLVNLAGQRAAPNASARAAWSRSRGMVFTGRNLPPLPEGRVYQLWVVTAQAPVSAGLLRPDAQGGVSGTFVTPPDISAPVALAVTIEPEGGVPAPTGDKYLVGLL